MVVCSADDDETGHCKSFGPSRSADSRSNEQKKKKKKKKKTWSEFTAALLFFVCVPVVRDVCQDAERPLPLRLGKRK